MDEVFRKVEAARAEGLDITADMYTYTAGATGLDAAMPPWVQEGGHDAWVARLKDPEIRARVIDEMRTAGDGWENLYHSAGGADKLLLLGFRNDDLKPLTGKTVAEVAQMRGTSPEDTMIDLVIEDDSRVGTAYFLMSEENIHKKIAQPWMAFGSDAESLAPEGVFLESNPHPRAYGTFARLLGKYVREEGVISLSEAIRRLTSFPAGNLGIDERGRLQEGYFADIAIFDPETIQRPRHVRRTAPVRHRRGARTGQRGARADGRGAHRSDTGPLCPQVNISTLSQKAARTPKTKLRPICGAWSFRYEVLLRMSSSSRLRPRRNNSQVERSAQGSVQVRSALRRL